MKMTALTTQPNNFTVHVGYEGSKTVILAKWADLQVRFIPRGHFYSGNKWDLPTPLVNDRFHWL